MDEDKPYPVEPLESKRGEFEQGVKKAAVEQFGYSSSDAMLKTILERNRSGRYVVEWVYGAWIGYNMAHAEPAKP